MSLINRFLTTQRINVNRLTLAHFINVYRIVVVIGFLMAVALTLTVPAHMSDPDDWAYYYGAKNFSQGQFIVDNQTHSQQVSQAQQQGGQLIQYVNIGDNRWALEKAPGYVLYLIPFELLGIPRWGNVLLALGMIVVTFIVLKRMRDEKTAMIGSLLMLFTPISLVMLNRSFMDTYSSLAFLVMGGGLYLYYHLESNRLNRTVGQVLLFLAFLLTSWSVVARYTNFPVAAILFLHFVITRFMCLRKGERTRIRSELLAVLPGIILPAAVLLLYDYFVFGSPLNYGYRYTHFPIKFAIQYLGQLNQNGQSIPLQIIWNNLKNAPRALLLGFPLLIIGIPGIITVLYYKFAAFFQRSKAPGKWSSLNTELPWDLLLILIGWFISVFFLYLTYEWTAEFRGSGSFVIFDRFYLPGLFPVVIICALVISRLPFKLYIPVIAIAVVFGSLLFAQSALNINILPGWLSNQMPRGMPGGRPGGIPQNGFPGGGPPGGGQPGGIPPGFPQNGR